MKRLEFYVKKFGAEREVLILRKRCGQQSSKEMPAECSEIVGIIVGKYCMNRNFWVFFFFPVIGRKAEHEVLWSADTVDVHHILLKC